MDWADPASLRAVAGQLAAGLPLDREARRLAATVLSRAAAAAEDADERRARRDEALEALVATYRGPGVALERACHSALGFLNRYEAGRWRHDQCLPEPPAGCDRRVRLAHEALAHGPVPRTTRRLRAIVEAVEETLKRARTISTAG